MATYNNGLQFDSAGNLLVTFAGGGAGGAVISAGTNSQNTGTVVFSNSNGVSFGLNAAGVLTATVTPGAAAGIAAIQLPNTTYTSGTVVFSNSNGISFGSTAGGGITASYTVPGATVFSNSNNVTFGLNGSTITGSASFAQSALSFSNLNGVSFGTVGSTLTASINSTSAAGLGTTFAGTNISASLTLNTAGLNLALSGGAGGGGSPNVSAGTTSGNLGSFVFSNSNGVSFGLNGSTITASASGAGASGTILALGNTTAQSSSNTMAFSAFNVSGSGIVSVGMSGQTLVISAPGTTNFANLSVSAGTTSGSLGSLVFSNSNGVTFGLNGSTITASAAGGAGAAISAGTQSTNGGTIVFSNSNGVSFGMSNSSVITASAAAALSTVGLYALGNTTQNSSTTLDQRSLSFNALGAMTIGYTNGSIQISAPATSSLSATGAVSISTNGGTISIGVPAAGTFSNAYFPYKGFDLAAGTIGQGSILFDPVSLPNLTFDRLLIPIYNTNSAVSSGSHSLSFYAGIYSRNASSLSLIGSASGSTAVTHSGQAGSYSLYSGVRHFSMASASSLSHGQYWMAFASRTSSAGADGSYYNMQLNNGSFTDALLSGVASYGGIFGSSVNNTNQFQLGQGYYTASSTGMPASIAFSQINGTASNAANMQAIIFGNSTV